MGIRLRLYAWALGFTGHLTLIFLLDSPVFLLPGFRLLHILLLRSNGRSVRAIRAEFSAAAGRTDHPLANFEIGLGLATGRAVAGKIGSVDQVKVTVFGPVVNLASRLENMTKQLRAGILLDADTAAYVRQHMLQETARVRRLAVVQPYGMQHSVEVSELLPSLSEYPQLTDEHIASYEQAVDALL